MKYVGILIWAATACSGHSIENEVVGEPTVDCEESLVGLTFKTKKPFSGRVYVHGMAGDEKCSKAFLKNRNQSRLSMRFKNGDCTMQRQRVTGKVQIDVDGCAIDPTIQPDVLYEDGKAIVEVFGYKFSDATVLNYECILEICRSPFECEGLSPPACSMDQTNTASDIERVRRSRAIVQELGHKRGQIEVAATLTMEDSVNASTVTSGNALSYLEDPQVANDVYEIVKILRKFLL
ncbi:unnamed protein product [Cylicocyclus nassatus]|uniref:Cuticlin N-terminal domain-containing protein n=1 Tax=Cylicocyclus nassatus TaxID=53992 RepID=A0AA36HEV0_CYLNA|nr:unnamed protein product [Cylicocyclus nassatus]